MKLKFVSLVIFLTIFVLAIAIGIVVIKGYISQKQLLPITEKEKPMAIKKESEETLVYLTFVINVHDFVNLTESADVIKKAMEVYKKYNVKGEFYLTSTMWEKYKENYPEIIELLKDEKHATVSYHIRPPHPVYPGFTSKIEGLNKEELKEILRKYETHSLNLETGNYENKEGGYALMKKDLGYAPPSAGIFSDKPEIVETEVEILKEMGLSMIVRHGDGGSLADFGEKKYGLWIRPADFEILEDENGKAWWNTDKKPADLLSEKISYFTEKKYPTLLRVNILVLVLSMKIISI